MKKDREEVEGEKEQESSERPSVLKRKRVKRSNRLSRWSGAIVLVIILITGFLLWVSGEVKQGTVGGYPGGAGSGEGEGDPVIQESGQGAVIIR